LHTARDNLCTLAFAAIVARFVLALPQPSFDIDLAAFGEALVAVLRDFAVNGDIVPVSAFMALAVFAKKING
jgi:hypothetical protein